MATKHALIELARRYPQLVVPIQEGACKTDLYRELVLQGRPAEDRLPDFSFDPGDTFQSAQTPAGSAEVLFLRKREDFEHAVRALAYKCEPQAIPASMGAIAIGGLIDWGKISAHKQAWLFAGNNPEEWAGEFRAFTKVRENFLSSIIILSSGPYSAVSAEDAGLEAQEWLADSIAMRKYHELAHVVSRRLYPGNQNAIRDEVLADYVGLVAVFGTYAPHLAKLFLGIEGEGVREGGRLRNYVEEGESLADAERYAHNLVDAFAQFDQGYQAPEGQERHFAALEVIESQRLGL